MTIDNEFMNSTDNEFMNSTEDLKTITRLVLERSSQPINEQMR